MHHIRISPDPADASTRNSVGGAAFLPQGTINPQCGICDAPMALFLQFDIHSEFGLPFAEGSHFIAFMCPTHNEVPSIPSDYEPSELPDDFWIKDEGHYSLQLIKPDISVSPANPDPFILGRRLEFSTATETVRNTGSFDRGSDDFKIGGVPGWINYSVNKSCPCGGSMSFICQIPDSFGFKQTDTAPEQPDSFSKSEYCFMLGNQVFIFGCDRQCNPNALIAVCDN